jgi:fatty acid desaturase
LEFWFVRVWLLLELLACVFSGHFVFWSIQFVITLWYNTFLVVASHDFEREEGDAPLRQLSEKLRSDWAAQPIQLSYDLSVVGIRWLDVFLTAGLSPHRVHHVLPTQRSGFSNIASERIVREVCEEAGLVWHPPRNLWFDRFPAIFRRFLLAPAQRPESGVAKPANTVPWPVAETSVLCRYVVAGWKGVGAV